MEGWKITWNIDKCKLHILTCLKGMIADNLIITHHISFTLFLYVKLSFRLFLCRQSCRRQRLVFSRKLILSCVYNASFSGQWQKVTNCTGSSTLLRYNFEVLWVVPFNIAIIMSRDILAGSFQSWQHNYSMQVKIVRFSFTKIRLYG